MEWPLGDGGVPDQSALRFLPGLADAGLCLAQRSPAMDAAEGDNFCRSPDRFLSFGSDTSTASTDWLRIGITFCIIENLTITPPGTSAIGRAAWRLIPGRYWRSGEYWEVAGWGGIIFLLIGLWRFRKNNSSYFLWWWIGGVALYVLIFFNLSVIHNYYQLPLLAPAAILMAKGLMVLRDHQTSFAWLGLLLLIGGNGVYAERNYYQVPHHLVEIGQALQRHTAPEDLLVVTYRKFDCRNPRILYRARRRGWSIEEQALKPAVLSRLQREEGATVWAYIGPKVPTSMTPSALPAPEMIPLANSDERLFLFSLDD